MTESPVKRVELWNFKAFDRFTVRFNGSAYIVGPNAAGKSTIIAAIRTCALMLRWAGRRNPTEVLRHGDSEYYGHLIAPGQFALVEENLRPSRAGYDSVSSSTGSDTSSS